MSNSPKRVGSLRNKIGPNLVLDGVAVHQSRYDEIVAETMLNGMHYVLETAIDGDFFWAYPDFVQLLSVVPPKLLDKEVLITDVLATNEEGDYVNMPNVRFYIKCKDAQ
jgi:hypothetical protein